MLIESVTSSLVDRCTKVTWKQEHGGLNVNCFELVSCSSVALILREDVGSPQTSNFRFVRMQKQLLSKETHQSGCIQNDLVLHKLFEDAIAVLRLAGGDDNSAGKN